MNRQNKWQCPDCFWRGDESQLLTGKSPFSNETVEGCPNCKLVIRALKMCDESGCVNIASNGWMSPDGYRFTCHEHYRP